MATQKLNFENDKGDRLSALLELPEDGVAKAFALIAHCFTCSKNYRAPRGISRALAEAGIAALAFDFTGLGESEGEFANTSFSSNVEDLVSAAAFLERDYDAPKILIGHSLGGAAVLHAASRIPSAEAVAVIAAPAELTHLSKLLSGRMSGKDEEGSAEVTIAGRSFSIGRKMLEDLEAARMEDAISGLGKPLMIFHSPADMTVGIENALTIFSLASHPKSFISIDGADHLLSRREDAEFVAGVIAAWAGRYTTG